MCNDNINDQVTVSPSFDNYWRKQLALSDSIDVSINKDCSTNKYNISITVSIGREDMVNDNLSNILGIIKNSIELKIAEL